MNKIKSFQDYSSKNDNDGREENQRNNNRNIKSEKILCEHCGRTSSNGIRCLGICVADNEY